MRPKKLVVATPVAATSTRKWLKSQVDEFVCLRSPRYFGAVGHFYESFSQISDDEAVAMLRQAEQALFRQAREGLMEG